MQGRYPRIHGEAVSLMKMGHEVTVLGWDRTCSLPPGEAVDGIRVERVFVKSSEMRGPVQAFFILAFWARAILRLLRMEADVIHCHNLDVLPLGYAASRLKRCRVVFDAHEPDYYALWPEKWKPLLRLVDLVESFFARRADCVIVTNGYQMEKFRAMGVRDVAVIANYPVGSLIAGEFPADKFGREGVVFGRIGTLYEDVGIEEAMGAFEGIMGKYPEAGVLLAGRVVDSYRAGLEEAISRVRERVTLLGAFEASRMPELYRKIDVSLMIYRRNDWFRHITPTKFFDSIANAVPVIMTDIGGLGRVIVEHGLGIVVDEDDPAGIRNAMELMITDHGARRRMAENCLRLARSEFNWGRMEQRLGEAYEALKSK